MILDAIDRRILRALQRDASLQNVELAKEVGLSPSPCLRRVRALEAAGVIECYVAVVNPARVGLGLTFFTRVWLTAQHEDVIDHFIAEVLKMPPVVECYLMLGDCDAMLRIVAADIESYRRFQANHLSRIKGVQNVKTELPSQTIKQFYALPI